MRSDSSSQLFCAAGVNMNDNEPKATKLRILDAAEELFARDGYAATSLRRVTELAGVNLAGVNYHFGSKEGLLEAVIARRIVPVNALRKAQLDAALAAAAQQGVRPEPRAVWRAMVEPTLRLREPGSGAEHFIALVGRVLANSPGPAREIFLRHMLPLMYEFFTALQQALPGISKSVLYWRIHFAIGALSHLMRCNEQGAQLPPGVEPVADAETLITLLLDFTTAGLEAKPC
jgi:AcrR family transcriptional regulator